MLGTPPLAEINRNVTSITMQEEPQAETTGTAPEADITNEPSQNPVEEELKREEKRTTRSEPEKAAYTLQKQAERAKELGLDPAEILGLKTTKDTEGTEGTVVTLEMLDAREKERGQKTALQLADELSDEHERNLAKKYLLEKIVPSGDPHEDLRFARLAINALKNSVILEEAGRKGTPSRFNTAAGAPAKQVAAEIELSPSEVVFTKPPFNLTKEQIVAARPTQ